MMQKVVSKPQILITGATGQQGGALAHCLSQKGTAFRALSRSPGKLKHLSVQGHEVVEGSLSEAATLKEALQGIKQAFLVTTPFEKGVEAEVEQGINFINAAKAAGIEHLVFTSVASADQKTGIPHFESKWQIERHLQKAGIPYSVLRPVFFMENFGSPWFFPDLEKGVLSFPIQSQKQFQMTCLDDIGHMALALFENPSKAQGKVIELASDSLSLDEVVQKISQASSKKIQYKQINKEEARKKYGEDFMLMLQWFDQVGYSVDISTLKQTWNVPLTSFESYLKKADWIKKLS